MDEELEGAAPRLPRESTYLQGIIIHPAHLEPIVAKVRNISAGGVMAEADGRFAVGDALQIELARLGVLSGKIVWVAGRRIGVNFDESIDPKKARRPVIK